MQSVVVTGVNGGIGKEVSRVLENRNYNVIGIDLEENNNDGDVINFDLLTLENASRMEALRDQINDKIGDTKLVCLVNNAAIQIVRNFEDLSNQDFLQTLKINLFAPFVLAKMLMSQLEIAHGQIINIGSIHSNLTKQGFVAYATSKAGLDGLTKSLAVEVGNRVRVNAILPAAIETEMLLDGFKGKLECFKQLENFHPTNKIGSPVELAKFIHRLISDEYLFMNGALIEFSGGIGSVLHDPESYKCK